MIFDVAVLETALNAKGINLLNVLKASLTAQGASQQEKQKIADIYKKDKIANDFYHAQLFVPFFDSTVFNQNINTTNVPSYIAGTQFYDANSTPAVPISGVAPSNSNTINQTTVMSNLIWFITFEKRDASGIADENDSFMVYRFLAKCWCHIQGERAVCLEGDGLTGRVRCGRVIWFNGTCSGDCGGNNN